MVRRSSRAITLFLLLIVAVAASDAGALDAPSSAYEVLRRHGLPIGIFPKGVTDFRLDDEGRFVVHLPVECTAKFETEVHYDRNVTGTLSYGQIASISGVFAQELFLWFPVRGIRVDIPSSGLIYFDVGVIYKRFSLSLFEIPPECSPAIDSRDHLLEGFRVAQIVSENQSGKLRYDLDQGDDSSTDFV
ncbi:hypothetical protein HPP92_003162 [Vanilla planifolia]|uniref:Uncharacterized protein n=1 Tax=Vanilla planifolia TaxID=51239 RepID=A0A835S2I1_VANPL|nr:hypothetical protein HPP92_003552 [Vanilla planifolia]KAG0503090.1 hypothetical protein HPP92_003162 [Vanilla planifolia]